jgi:3-deoxy-7-phosphoheptulonate synthase
MSSVWTKSGWRSKERIQMPEYTDAAALKEVEERLSSYPPLVFAGEARQLRKNTR